MGTGSNEATELRETLKSLMETERERIQARADGLQQAIDSLTRDPNAIRFEVQITSAWQNEGEKNVKVRSRKSLSDAIKRAQKKFKEVNNRNDVQGTYIAYAVIGTNRTWTFNLYQSIPQKLFSYLL